MSFEIVFDEKEAPQPRSLEFAAGVVKDIGVERCGSVWIQHTTNGTFKVVRGLTLHLACKKLGDRYKPRYIKIDLEKPERLHALERPRMVGSQELVMAVRICDDARPLAAARQSAFGGDLRSPKMRAELEKRKLAKTAIASHEPLSNEPLESDSQIKNAGSQESINKVAIASDLSGLGTNSIEQGIRFRKAHPDLFEDMERGKFKTFAEAKQRAIVLVKEQRVATTIERYERQIRQKNPSNFQLIVGDNSKILPKRILPPATVIFADVPYNNGWKYDSDPTDDNLSDDAYLSRLRVSFSTFRDAMTENGTLYVLSNCKYQDRISGILRGLHFHWKDTLGYWNHFPNNQVANHPEAFKPLQVWTKSKTSFIWHPPPVETVRNAIGDARGTSAGKVPDNVMAIRMIPGNSAKRVPFPDAPPLLPKELIMRCICTSSEPGDVVLDPYSGNGTTAIAALQAGRISINIERSQKYADQSRIIIEASMREEISPYFQAIIAGVVPPVEENGRCGACGAAVGKKP